MFGFGNVFHLQFINHLLHQFRFLRGEIPCGFFFQHYEHVDCLVNGGKIQFCFACKGIGDFSQLIKSRLRERHDKSRKVDLERGLFFLGGGFLGREENPTFNNCSMMIAIDVAAFRELPLFKGELDRLIGTLKGSPVMEGGEVLHPGELEARREKERRKNGIPLAGPTVEALQAELDRYGVSSRLVERALAAPRAV